MNEGERMLIASVTNIYFWRGIIVLADGTTAATAENGDFGTSPFFGNSRTRRYLPVTCMWGVGRKAQWRKQRISNFIKQLVGKTRVSSHQGQRYHFKCIDTLCVPKTSSVLIR